MHDPNDLKDAVGLIYGLYFSVRNRVWFFGSCAAFTIGLSIDVLNAS